MSKLESVFCLLREIRSEIKKDSLEDLHTFLYFMVFFIVLALSFFYSSPY